MPWIFALVCAGLIVHVLGSQRRIERRLDSIERHLGARRADWE